MFPWAYEVKDLARRVQGPSLRPIAKVGFHPCLWDGERRILFIQDASQFMDTAPYLDVYRRMQNIKSTLLTNNDWRINIPPNIIADMEKPRRLGKHGSYDYYKPRHLLRFIRNIFYHLPEVLNSNNMQKADCQFLGQDKLSVQKKFCVLFLELVIKI